VKKIHQILWKAALAWSAAFVFISCGKNETNTTGVFTYNESNGITSLDPAFARDLEIMWATNQLFDGLLELDSALQVQPLIAKSWDVSSDGLTYTFHLRNDVLFHPSPLFADSTNRRVVASDFVYSFGRILDPAVASPGQWIFKTVNTEINGGFEAPNDTTFVIHLKTPFQPFLGMLCTQYCNVVPHEVVDHYKQDFRSHPIGTGPFKFAFWYENVSLVFHKNTSFWQKDEMGNPLPYLDAIKIDLVKDMSVEYQGLLQGRYDFMSGIHAAFKDELLDANGNMQSSFEDKLHLQKVPFIKTDYLGFYIDKNAEQQWLLDPRVRKAISLAIDKKKMVRYLRNNNVFAAGDGFVPPALLPAKASSAAEYNPEKAKTLLAESGFDFSNKLVLTTTSDYADLMEFVQHELEKINVKAEVQIMQSGTFREATAKGQLMCFRKSWLADYADAENFLSVFTTSNYCPAGPNYTHFSSEEFDNLYAKASAETNDSLRMQHYEKMDAMIAEASPVIPLYYDQVTHFVRNVVHGLETNSVNMLDLKRVRKSAP
jgi:peptide/nickel transport system substrate-binding protein